MSQNLSFDIKIPEGQTIQFSREATFENFIGQFQQFCPKLLCVIDGTYFHYYDNTTALPNNIRFDYKQRRGKLTEYYFRDIGNDTLYCVFGREAAKIIFPRIDEVDPVNPSNSFNSGQESIIPQESKVSTSINSPPNVTKRPPIVQAIKPTQITNIPPKINTVTRIIPTRSNVPESIIIIDKDVRLIFSNPNYPIEVTTYYP